MHDDSSVGPARARVLRYAQRPSALRFMAEALFPPHGRRRRGSFPDLSVQWSAHRVSEAHRRAFCALTELEPHGEAAALLYPYVLAFPLHMVVLTRPSFPRPIWSTLQIRNHLLLHRRIDAGDEVTLETRVASQRRLEKGVEVDLFSTVHARDELAWESTVTFYYRGGASGGDAPSPASRSPTVPADAVATWRVPRRAGLPFARLTGDYNGIHVWSRYARLFGFRGAFMHPSLAVGRALAQLVAPTGTPQRLDVWLKGPVYYDDEVREHARIDDASTTFGLYVAGDARPAIVGRWSAVAERDTSGEHGRS